MFGDEGGELVMPGCYTLHSVASNPRMNIVAGMGYLMMRMAEYGFKTVREPGGRVSTETVKPGDSLSTIAKRCGSTVDTLQLLNPGSAYLKPGQQVNCQRASVQKAIVGWRTFTPRMIARRYNGNGEPSGDARYAEKLEYTYESVKRRNPQ